MLRGSVGGATLRRTWAGTVAVLVALVGVLLPAVPARAAGVGYIRLAHLVPDGIKCDMYIQLDKVDGDVLKMLPSIDYGTVSAYEPVPVGTYAVTMRKPGAPATSAPVLAASITVEEGKAYTAARMGSPNDAKARVFPDDRTLPPADVARVRVVQAAQRSVAVDVVDGPSVGAAVGFATVTDYVEVSPGARTLRVQPAGGAAVTVPARLQAGAVYSVLVLENADGSVGARVRADAVRSGKVPVGAVQTGAGGTAVPRPPLPGLVAAGVLVLLVMAFSLYKRKA